MTPPAGRGGNPPYREHPISAGRRHPGGRLRTGQVTPPRADLAGSPPPAPAAGRRPQPRARPPRGDRGELRGPGGFRRQSPGAQSAAEDAGRAAARRGRGSTAGAPRAAPADERSAVGRSPRPVTPPVPFPDAGQPAPCALGLAEQVRTSGKACGLPRLFKPNFCSPGMLAIRAWCGFFNPSP